MAVVNSQATRHRPVGPGRRPQHPGQFLDSRFLKPLSLSQESLAKSLGVSRRRINEIIKGRRGLTPDTALRLARYFGGDAESWLNLQNAYDLKNAQKELAPKISKEVMPLAA